MDEMRFVIYKNLFYCTDSLLFKSGTQIAEVSQSFRGVSLEVCGDVLVEYQGKMYTDPENFPETLVSMIREGEIADSRDVIVHKRNEFRFLVIEHGVKQDGIGCHMDIPHVNAGPLLDFMLCVMRTMTPDTLAIIEKIQWEEKHKRDLYFRACSLLTGNHIWVYREMEVSRSGREYTCRDGRVLRDGEYRMILVRPFTPQGFQSVYHHGQRHCNEFEIYGISDDFKNLTRPHLYNDADVMYTYELSGGWTETEYVEKQKRLRIETSEVNSDRLSRMADDYYSQYVLGDIYEGTITVVDIVDLGGGAYNIIIKDSEREDERDD